MFGRLAAVMRSRAADPSQVEVVDTICGQVSNREEKLKEFARSANTGISGFINGRGDVISTLGWDRRGTLSEQIALNDRITFYTRYGDYIARIACYVLLLSVLYYVAYRVRKRNHLVD